MSEFATRDALEMAGLEAGEIDAVILATVTHPYQTPAAAPALADRMGMGSPAAFDISAACAGYCHGISLASDMVRGGSARNVAVVGVERLSDFTSRTDRGTAFIFGDGAGAAIVTASDTAGIGPTVWGSEGDKWDVIAQNERRIDVHEQKARLAHDRHAGPAGLPLGRLGHGSRRPARPRGGRGDGRPGSTPSSRTRPTSASSTPCASRLKVPDHVAVARDIVDSANTSAASVPLATERLLREGLAPRGGLALQIGFGAGLSYAAQVVTLP